MGCRSGRRSSPAHGPYKKNDQATVESKNNHLVRKYGFYYRYDTDDERVVLNRLWQLVNDRFNYLTPTKKPVGFGTDTAGRRKRLYDTPATPLDRLLAANVLSPEQQAELLAHRERFNPAKLARDIAELQTRLRVLAKDKTEQLPPRQHPQRPTRRPQRHPRQGQLSTRVSRASLSEALTPVSRAP